MWDSLKKSFKSKLVLNFLGIGLVSFILFWITGGLPLTFLIIGPPLFVADRFRALINLPFTSYTVVKDFFILLPITLLYYFLIGFHQYHLNREKGWIRHLTRAIVILFFLVIHFKSWIYLSAYYIPHR